MVKCYVTEIKISEVMGFVKIIREIKTINVSLLKISMVVQIVGEILTQLCSNDSIQIHLNGLVLNVRNRANLKRICMGSPEHNRGNISSLIGGKNNAKFGH